MKKVLSILIALLLTVTQAHAYVGYENPNGGSATSDNLGNHTATQAIDMQSLDIDNINCPPYSSSWNGSTMVPCKDAIYDKIETISATGGNMQLDGTTVHPTDDTYDLAVGGSTFGDSSIYMDESAGTVFAQGGMLFGNPDTDASGTIFIYQRASGNVLFTWNETAQELQLNVPLNITANGQTVLSRGVVANNDNDTTSEADSAIKGGSVTIIGVTAATDLLTGLGYWDLSGTTLQQPNGSSCDSTITASGESCMDTDDDQYLVGGNGGNVRVLSFKKTMNVGIPSPISQRYLLHKAVDGYTIRSINCIVDPADTGDSQVIDIQECDSTGDNCTTVDATIACDNDGAADDGSLSNPSIDAGDWLAINVGATTGTVSVLTATVLYDVVAE